MSDPLLNRLRVNQERRSSSKRAALTNRIAELEDQNARLRKSMTALNHALDNYWDSSYGLTLTGMGENFLIRITEAQAECRAAMGNELP